MKRQTYPKHHWYSVRKITDIKDMLRGSAERYAENTAFLVKKDGAYQPILYKEFYRELNAIGTALLRENLGGERVAIIGENSYYWALSFLTSLCGVGVNVPIDKELPANEIATLLNAADTGVVIYSAKVAEKVESILGEVPTLKKAVQMERDLPELIQKGQMYLDEGDRSYLDAEIDPEAMAEILFTSGTTGNPKGVMLCHRNLVSNIMGMCSMIYFDENDCFLSVLPMHHTYECTCGMMTPLYQGARIAYCEGLRYITKNMQEAKATIMLGVPLIFENIYRKLWQQAKKAGLENKLKTAIRLNKTAKKVKLDFSKQLFKSVHDAISPSIRIFISGAAGLNPSVAEGLNDLGFMTLQGYGLTECSPIAAVHYENRINNASCGEVINGGQLRILDPNEQGIGEVLIKSGSVMMGYYNDPEATAEVLDEDGWFHSGDLGRLDEEGFLYIMGRKKNVIVAKNGKNVFPEEIEAYLSEVPYVAECLVFGRDNEKGDTEVVAQIIVNEEAVTAALGEGYTQRACEALLRKEITAINNRIPLYKRLDDFSIRTEPFRKTTTQKIKRHLETGAAKAPEQTPEA